jgi:uncharacterized protein YcbK (DUF882 family)
MNAQGKKGQINILKDNLSRRRFLSLGLLTAASGLLPVKAMASVGGLLAPERTLFIYNLHTKEEYNAAYWKDGKYIPEELDRINFIFRDHYNGRVKPIDRKLLNLLFSIQQELDCDEPFHLISAYRSPRTNAFLSKRNSGVAKRSLHLYGKAVDIRLPGHKLKKLRRAAYELKCGGVGYYPRSNFVHVDVGKVRYW